MADDNTKVDASNASNASPAPPPTSPRSSSTSSTPAGSTMSKLKKSSLIDIITILLQLNLKLFRNLYCYKYLFNQFKAEINSYQLIVDNNNDGNDISQNNIDNGDQLDDNRPSPNGTRTSDAKETMCNRICEKFQQICQQLSTINDNTENTKGNNAENHFENYESSMYSILAIVDDFNGDSKIESSILHDALLIDTDEIAAIQRRIDSFLTKLSSSYDLNNYNYEKFQQRLMKQLQSKLLGDDHVNDRKQDDSGAASVSNLQVEYFEQDTGGNGLDDNENTGGPMMADHQQHQQRYLCKFCRKIFPQITQLIGHQRSKHQSRFVCFRCNHVFRNEYVMRIHLRKDTCLKLNDNGIDGNDIDNRDGIEDGGNDSKLSVMIPSITDDQQQQEQPVADDDGNFCCRFPGCTKKFKRSTYLRNHMVTHRIDRNFICPMPNCFKRYKAHSHLMSHITQSHRMNSVEFHLLQQQQQQQLKTADSSNNEQQQQQSMDIDENNDTDNIDDIKYDEYCPEQSYQSADSDDRTLQNDSLNEDASTMVTNDDDNGPSDALPPSTAAAAPAEGFKCSVCSTTFQKKSSLSNHIKSHYRIHTCPMYKCHFRSQSYESLLRHISIRHKQMVSNVVDGGGAKSNGNSQRNNNADNNKDYQSIIPTRQQEVIDIIKSNNQTIFKCKLCSKQFTKRSPIMNHLRSHSHQLQLLQCNDCAFATYSQTFMDQHLTSHHSNGGDSNDAGGPNGDGQQSLTTTTTAATTTIKLFNCHHPGCAYQTEKRSWYRAHLLRHTELRIHRCCWSNCGKAFKAKTTLNQHLRRHRLQYFQQQLQQNQSADQNESLDPDDQHQSLEPEITNDDGDENEDTNNQQEQADELIDDDQKDSKIEDSGKLSILEQRLRLRNRQNKSSTTIYECNRENCRNRQFDSMKLLQKHLKLVHNNSNNQEDEELETIQPPSYQREYNCIGWNNCQQTFRTKRKLLAHYLEHRKKQCLSLTNANTNESKSTRILRCIWSNCKYQTTIVEQLKLHMNQHRKQTKLSKFNSIKSANAINTTMTEHKFVAMPFVASITSTPWIG